MTEQSLALLAVGDVYLDRPDPASAFRHVVDAIGAADVAFCNLEGPCSAVGSPTIGKFITIGMQPDVVAVLAKVGFDVAAFANNHALDYGYEAFVDTLDRLAAAGIAGVGGGRNLAEARRAAILAHNGLRLGFLAYAATIPWGYAATDDRPGIAPVRVQTYYEPRYQIMSEQPGMPARVINVIDAEDLTHIQRQVQELKAEVDAVVVSFHWGVAYLADPAPYQPPLAHAIVEAGADLVLGHHAHILQGVEMYQGVPIFYSLSNFVFDYDEPRFGEQTMLLNARFGSRGLEQLALRPVILPPLGDPRPVTDDEGEAIKHRLQKLSVGMNTRFEWDGTVMHVMAIDA